MGQDGEIYAWTRIHRSRDPRWTSRVSCRFDIDDEEAAFAYAEERLRATASRLAVANRATQTATKYCRTPCGLSTSMARLNAAPINLCMTIVGESAVTRSAAEPTCGRPSERIFAQYTQFESRTLAVRGENLHLTWSRSYDDAGNETTCLHVSEIGDDGRFIYEGRFDEDDFETA